MDYKKRTKQEEKNRNILACVYMVVVVCAFIYFVLKGWIIWVE